MKKICPLCETENDKDALFCKECNEPLYKQEKFLDAPYLEEIRKNRQSGLFGLFSKKTPSYYSLEEISNAAFKAIRNNASNKDIINILRQGLYFIDKATANDIQQLNLIASLLARPRFREMGMAVKIWERIVEIEPLNFEALRFLVSWYIHQGSTSDIYKKGKLLLEADYKNGIKKDKEITQFMGKAFAAEFGIQNLEKDTSSLYWHLGTFYIKNNDYPLAVSAMNVALELNPNNIDALNNIAIAYFMMEDYAIALRWYKKCLSVTPIEMYKEYEESLEKHDLKPTSWMGGIQAKEKIRQLIAQAESEILFGIGECLFLLNQTDDARDAFRKSVEKSEKFPHSNLTEAVEEILTVLQNKYR